MSLRSLIHPASNPCALALRLCRMASSSYVLLMARWREQLSPKHLPVALSCPSQLRLRGDVRGGRETWSRTTGKRASHGLSCAATSVDPKSFHLLAPYSTDAKKWASLTWADTYSGAEFGVVTGLSYLPELVSIRSLEDIKAESRAR